MNCKYYFIVGLYSSFSNAARAKAFVSTLWKQIEMETNTIDKSTPPTANVILLDLAYLAIALALFT
jgi:hypothetical protein